MLTPQPLTLLYRKLNAESIALQYALTALAILAGITLCAARLPASPAHQPLSPWRTVNLGENLAQPLQAPTVLDSALIWRPLGEAALVFSSLDGTIQHRYDWLRGTPLEWTAHQTKSQIYLTWRTTEGVLWGARLGLDGAQHSAPIEYARESASGFRTGLLPNGLLVVGWRSERTLYMRTVQAGGTSLPPLAVGDAVDDFAFLPLSDDLLFIAWRSGDRLLIGEIRLDDTWQVGRIESIHPIEAFSLPPDSWLATLEVLINNAQRIVIWGVTSAAQPDTEVFGGAWQPLTSRATPQYFDLRLPGNPPLRWGRAHQGSAWLTLGVFQDDDWDIVRVAFGAGGAQSFQQVEGQPATGSSAGLAGDHVAWVSLNLLGEPYLYVTTLDSRYGSLQYPPVADDWRRALEQGIRKSPYLLLWLVLPTFCGLLLRGRPYRLPVVVAAYWVGKCLVPLGLFSAYPVVWGRGQPAFVVGWVALFGISRVAALVGYIGWGKTPPVLRHAAYFLTDAFLTFAFFGAAVE